MRSIVLLRIRTGMHFVRSSCSKPSSTQVQYPTQWRLGVNLRLSHVLGQLPEQGMVLIASGHGVLDREANFVVGIRSQAKPSRTNWALNESQGTVCRSRTAHAVFGNYTSVVMFKPRDILGSGSRKARPISEPSCTQRSEPDVKPQTQREKTKKSKQMTNGCQGHSDEARLAGGFSSIIYNQRLNSHTGRDS